MSKINDSIYAKTAFLRRQGGNLAASLVWLDLLAPQRNATLSTLCTSSGRLSLHASLDLTGHGKESLFNIGRSLGRSFKKFNSEAISKFFSLLSGNNALARQIGLVTDQELVDILSGISVDFVQPLLYVVKGFLVRNVVNDDDTMGSTVVRGCNGTETLLSGSIPDLELDSLSVEFNSADFLQETRGSQQH
jgi:hypothetical protein